MSAHITAEERALIDAAIAAGKVRRPISAETRTAILTALKSGERRIDIARRLGVSKQSVSSIAAKAGFPEAYRTAAHLNRQGALSLGMTGFRPFVASLPDGVVNWLHEETPDGSSMAELIRAIIIDAYAEEQA